MKKQILFLFVAVTAVVLCFTRPVEVGLNNLILENIEAMALGEITEPVYCVGTGSVDCPMDNSKVKVVFGGYRLESR